MPIVLDGTSGITASAINAALDASDLTGNVAAARITTALNATGTAPIFAARAWVNFNGTGTVAIRASGNVSSITDNGTGNYTLNFTTAMPDANYTFTSGGRVASGGAVAAVVSPHNGTYTETALRVVTQATSTLVFFDPEVVNVAIFR